ncbi:MAG: hypothetical protein ABSC06_18340 [Rhodopila sp.]
MSGAGNLTDLAEAREIRRMREALARLDEAARAEHIEPESYLGRYHAAVMLAFEQSTAVIGEDRASREKFRVAMEDFQLATRQEYLELKDSARDVAQTYHAAARDELAKLDRMARKAETDAKRQQLALEDSTGKLIERMSDRLATSLKESNVIRAKAYNRSQWQKSVVAGVVAVLVLFGAGMLVGRVTAGGDAVTAVESGEQGNWR